MLVSTLASNPHPMAAIPGSKITWGTGNFLNMMRFDGDPSGLPLVFHNAWLSSNRYLVLVLRSDDCSGEFLRLRMKKTRVSAHCSARS